MNFEPPGPLPIIQANLQKLADTPPGQAADTLAEQIAKFVQSLLTDPKVTALIPANFAGYVSLAVVAIGLLISGGLLHRGIATPTPAARVSCQCGCVQTGVCTCPNCDKPATTKPNPQPTPQPAAAKYTLYVTKDVDAKSIADLKALGIAVEPTVYQPGVGFAGVSVPCIVWTDNGKVNAVPWTTVADAAKLVGGGK